MSQLVTIIIPCYNYGRYVAESIESCLAQTYKKLEIIVVDDGSTDNSNKIAQNYLDRGVKYVRQDNAGPAAARNKGIRESHGDYICFLDADDMFKLQYIEACYKQLSAAASDVGYVYTGIEYFGDKSGKHRGREYDIDLLKQENYIHASALFRASVLRNHSFDASIRGGLEDWDLFLTLAENGVYGSLLNKPLLRYRKHTAEGASISDKIDDELNINWARFKIQLRHVRFVGIGRIIHTLARTIRIALGIKR